MPSCKKCGADKADTDFRFRRDRPISTCRKCEREKQREYYWANPEVYRARSSKSMKKQRGCPERAGVIREKAREYYHAKGKHRESQYYRDLRENEPWRWRARNLARNITKEITEDWLRGEFARQGGICALSGRPLDVGTFHVDHIVPKRLGGSDDLSNLRLLSPEANMAKSGLSDEEFLSLCADVLQSQIPEMIGHAILAAESAA